MLPRNNHVKRCKPGWNEHVGPYKQECSFWFKLWCQAGKPTQGVLFDYYKDAKKQYLYAVRRIKRRENELRKEKLLDQMCKNNSRDFFKEIKKINSCHRTPESVNSLTDPKSIAQLFAHNYETLYNSVANDNKIMNDVLDYINDGLDHCLEETKVTVNMVKKAVKKLKKEKNDGDKGLSSCHLIAASDQYYEELSKLFTAMLVHGHEPEALLMATIVSIPKDNRGDLGSDSNYRGIALSSSIGKVFDSIFIERNSERLCSSDLQFAYKKKHGTSMCTLVIKEIIRHYINNGSDVYMCCLDASKAFDKIRHDKLFEILVNRHIPAADLRLLLDMYTHQKIWTKWLRETSNIFGASNGIRQGGIASPILFCCYMDTLISKLKSNGTGCWIGEHFGAAVAYADDLTLLSPTASGLQSMINNCETFGNEFGMTYNPNKSVCAMFSRRNKPSIDMFLNGRPLMWQKDVKHLGNHLSSDLREQKEMSSQKCDLIGRTNTPAGNAPKLIDRKVIMSIFSRQ